MNVSNHAAATGAGGTIVNKAPIAEPAIIADPVENEQPDSAPVSQAPAPAPQAPAPAPKLPAPHSTVSACAPGDQPQDENWFPGLPRPLGEPRYTSGGEGPDIAHASRYTDAAPDGLMNVAIARADARDSRAREADREFARQISNVRVVTDLRQTGRVRLSFAYRATSGSQDIVTLEGAFASQELAARVRVPLRQTGGEQNINFGARVTCEDANGDCQSVMVELARLDQHGQAEALVYIVHRWGNAQLTISDQDRFGFDRITTPTHRALAAYLSHTENNICLSALQRAAGALASCELSDLRRACGHGRPQIPAAQYYELRTYAVAYGRAGFEFRAVDRADDGAGFEDPAASLTISGALQIPGPTITRSLKVEGLPGVPRADLVANDGAGNINVRLIYAAGSGEESRLTITSRFQSTRENGF